MLASLLSAADRKAYGAVFHELDRQRYKKARQHARKTKNRLLSLRSFAGTR